MFSQPVASFGEFTLNMRSILRLQKMWKKLFFIVFEITDSRSEFRTCGKIVSKSSLKSFEYWVVENIFDLYQRHQSFSRKLQVSLQVDKAEFSLIWVCIDSFWREILIPVPKWLKPTISPWITWAWTSTRTPSGPTTFSFWRMSMCRVHMLKIKRFPKYEKYIIGV